MSPGQCQGPPIGDCPNRDSTSVKTKLCQGDLVLCSDCEEGRYGRRSGDSHAANDSNGGKTNLYINELLCFISNKVDNMAVDLLSKLVCDFYDSKVIEAAKKILFDVTEGNRPSEIRHIKHKKTGW